MAEVTPERQPDRHEQDRRFLSRAGDRETQGNLDADSFTGDGSLLLFTQINVVERSSDPADPPEGYTVIWMSDGTGSGDDGDLLCKITAGGSTKTGTIIDFSAV